MKQIAEFMGGRKPSMTTYERDATCETHGEHVEIGGSFFGDPDRVKWFGCAECNREQRERDEAELAAEEERKRQARIEKRIQTAGIPPAFRDRSFDSFIAESPEQKHALAVARDFAENFYSKHMPDGDFLMFGGNTGTGKSHMALAILQHVLKRHTGMYIDTMSMIRRVRATWRRDSNESEESVIDLFGSQLDLLAIDEIGVQRGTEDEQAILFDILNRRYRDLRPTILMTNLSGEALKEFLGPRIMDRLYQRMVAVPFLWDSYRRK